MHSLGISRTWRVLEYSPCSWPRSGVIQPVPKGDKESPPGDVGMMEVMDRMKAIGDRFSTRLDQSSKERLGANE